MAHTSQALLSNSLGVAGNVSFTATALEIHQNWNYLGWSWFWGSGHVPDVVSLELDAPSHWWSGGAFSVLDASWPEVTVMTHSVHCTQIS